MSFQKMGFMRFNVRILLLLTVAATAFVAMGCDDEETYAERKARERSQIDRFLDEKGIDVITLDEFLTDSVTDNRETGPDTTRNEFVLFPESGVYMQIVRRGDGTGMKDGEKKVFNCRFSEYNISSEYYTNMNLYVDDPDVMTCTRTGDYYTSTFKSGKMFSVYGSTVPTGWLVAIPYVNPGFYNGDGSAKVRLIVPHDKGTESALNSVAACYYEILLMSQKWQ